MNNHSKNNRIIKKWPWLNWKMGCFISAKKHSYCKKKDIPARVIVTTCWCVSEEPADRCRSWQSQAIFYNFNISFQCCRRFWISLSVYLRKNFKNCLRQFFYNVNFSFQYCRRFRISLSLYLRKNFKNCLWKVSYFENSE